MYNTLSYILLLQSSLMSLSSFIATFLIHPAVGVIKLSHIILFCSIFQRIFTNNFLLIFHTYFGVFTGLNDYPDDFRGGGVTPENFENMI